MLTCWTSHLILSCVNDSVKEKLNEDADCEIATTMLRVSLICPLGKMRMATPCRWVWFISIAIVSVHFMTIYSSLFAQSIDLFTFAMLRCIVIPSNEWTEADMELSRMRQAGRIRHSGYWWVNIRILFRISTQWMDWIKFVVVHLQLFPRRVTVKSFAGWRQRDSIVERWFVDHTRDQAWSEELRYAKEKHAENRYLRWHWWVQSMDSLMCGKWLIIFVFLLHRNHLRRFTEIKY